jgi:TonB family protein
MAATVRLARTRSLRRRPRGRWWWAALLAVGVNAGAVAVLAELAAARPPAAAVLPVREVDRLPPPDPDPPAESPAADEPAAEAAPAAVPALALPALDLAVADQPLTAALPPPVLSAPAPFDLPAVALPGVLPAAIAAPGAGAGGVAADRPAERAGSFDLTRFYPRAARRQGLRGTSVVRLAIAADGAVTAVAVERSEPAGAFEEAAQRLGRSLRYRPALRGGAPVASTQHLTIDWTLP